MYTNRKGRPARSNAVVMPADQVVLTVAAELDEIGAVARDAHDQVLILLRLLRLLLRLAQDVGGNDVVLDLHAAVFKIYLCHFLQLVDAVAARQRAGMDLEVHRQAIHEFRMIEADRGREHARGTVLVPALGRGTGVRHRFAGPPPVGRGPGGIALGDVIRRAVEPSFVVRAAHAGALLARVVKKQGDGRLCQKPVLR